MVLAAVGQICSTASMSHNLSQCKTIIQKAVAAGAKALFLPEASDYIASSPAESVSLCQPINKSTFVLGLQQAAKEHKLPINVGIHEPTDPPSEKIKNSLIWIDKNGTISHRYEKLHLFDVDLRPDGPYAKESESIEPGHEIMEPYSPTLGLPDFGSLICFDMRFPEPALNLRRRGARTLLYPSAFAPYTGFLHWDVLLRARAIETQSWVIAAGQCGRHNEKRVSYGGTIAIDPRGVVKGRLDNVDHTELDKEKLGDRQPQLLLVEMDMDSVEKVRKEIPLQRRTDVYPEV